MAGTMNSSGGGSKYSPGKPSSLRSLGVDQVVVDGSNGSRPSVAHQAYGGSMQDVNSRPYPGKQATSKAPDKNMNAGNNEKNSDQGAFVTDGKYRNGVYGPRENMIAYPGQPKNSGKLTSGSRGKASSTLGQGLSVQDKKTFKEGTGRLDQNKAKALAGIKKTTKTD